MKQMKIIHGSGFSERDRLYFIPFIHRNILSSAKSLADAMQRLHIPFSKKQNLCHALFISSFEDPSKIDFLSPDCVVAIQSLWEDPGVRTCYSRRREFQLQDSTQYYLDNLDRIVTHDFVPTDQDILRVRIPTTGINEYFFDLDSVTFRIVDVGGQRAERRKWIHCFDSVTSIIFLASLSEYDQVLLENQKESRMEESLALFCTIISFHGFKRASFILFLNKKDILEQKVLTSHFSQYYPEYDGPVRDHYMVRDFILKLYMRRTINSLTTTDGVDKGVDRGVYSHFTTATDTDNIRFVFAAVKDTILKINIQEYILSWSIWILLLLQQTPHTQKHHSKYE